MTNRPEDAPEALQPVLTLARGENHEGGTLPLCVRIWCEVLSPSSELFAAWLPILRHNVDSCACALGWGDDDVARCGPLSLAGAQLNMARETISALADRMAELAEACPETISRAPKMQEVEWLFVVCTSCSLTLPLGGDGDGTLQLIAPILDCVSHGFECGPQPFAQVVGEDVALYAVSDLQVGDAVTGPFYGNVSNDSLAVSAGFAVPDNPHHQVALSLSFGALRDTQLEALKKFQLEGFLRANEAGKASLVIVLRRSDPFPGVAIVCCRILSGSELSEDLRKGVCAETAEMDQKWLPMLFKVMKGHLQLYPPREEATHLADIVYCSTRDVLKFATGKLLNMMREIGAPMTA